MTPKRLEHIGQQLYGDHWKSPLARALGIRTTTLDGYRAGKWVIPTAIGLAAQYYVEHRDEALDKGLAPKTKRDRNL